MNEKWKALLLDLASHNITFVLSNLDKINFGDRDFMTKLAVRLILGKLQTAIKTKNFGTHLEDLLKNISSIVKK